MTNLIIAAILIVIGIGIVGGALFGRLRTRRLLLLSLGLVLVVLGGCQMLGTDQTAETPQPAADTPTAVAAQATAEPAEATAAPAATATPSPEPSPTPAPSLGQLVFPSQRGGNLDIWLMDLADPQHPLQLTTDPANDVEPVWSPDGTQILFASSRDSEYGVSELYVMNADGSEQRRLLEWPDSYEWGASWTPDGQKIAFTTSREGNFEIFVMNADGSGEPINLTRHPRSDTHPTFSPDGVWMAFSSDRSDYFEIWKLEFGPCLQAREEGKVLDERCEPIQLTDNLDSDLYPRWSPDGSRIAFESRREANRDIYTMNPDGGDLFRLTDDIAHDSVPIWALGGKAVIFGSERNFDWDLFIIDADGSNERRLTDAGGEDRYGDWKAGP